MNSTVVQGAEDKCEGHVPHVHNAHPPQFKQDTARNNLYREKNGLKDQKNQVYCE